jgi:hypothetical protein
LIAGIFCDGAPPARGVRLSADTSECKRLADSIKAALTVNLNALVMTIIPP